MEPGSTHVFLDLSISGFSFRPGQRLGVIEAGLWGSFQGRSGLWGSFKGRSGLWGCFKALGSRVRVWGEGLVGVPFGVP